MVWLLLSLSHRWYVLCPRAISAAAFFWKTNVRCSAFSACEITLLSRSAHTHTPRSSRAQITFQINHSLENTRAHTNKSLLRMEPKADGHVFQFTFCKLILQLQCNSDYTHIQRTWNTDCLNESPPASRSALTFLSGYILILHPHHFTFSQTCFCLS